MKKLIGTQSPIQKKENLTPSRNNKYNNKKNDKLLFTLKTLDLENLLNEFYLNYITFNDIFLLSREDLIEMKIPIGPRNRILYFAEEYKKKAVNYDLNELIFFFQNHKEFIINDNHFNFGFNKNNFLINDNNMIEEPPIRMSKPFQILFNNINNNENNINNVINISNNDSLIKFSINNDKNNNNNNNNKKVQQPIKVNENVIKGKLIENIEEDNNNIKKGLGIKQSKPSFNAKFGEKNSSKTNILNSTSSSNALRDTKSSFKFNPSFENVNNKKLINNYYNNPIKINNSNVKKINNKPFGKFNFDDGDFLPDDVDFGGNFDDEKEIQEAIQRSLWQK